MYKHSLAKDIVFNTDGDQNSVLAPGEKQVI